MRRSVRNILCLGLGLLTMPPLLVARAWQPAEPPLTVEALRRELVALQARVAELEEQVEELRLAGVGGAGILEQNVEEPDVRLQGPITVATAAFDGTVRSVSPDRIHVLDESGNVYDLLIDPRTRVFAYGEQFRPEELPEGTPVSASFALIQGVNHARDIVVLEEGEQLAPAELLEELVPPLP